MSAGFQLLAQLLLSAPARVWALILAGPPLTALEAWLIHLIATGGRIEGGMALVQLKALEHLAYAVLVLLGLILAGLVAVHVEADTRLGKISIGGDAPQEDR